MVSPTWRWYGTLVSVTVVASACDGAQLLRTGARARVFVCTAPPHFQAREPFSRSALSSSSRSESVSHSSSSESGHAASAAVGSCKHTHAGFFCARVCARACVCERESQRDNACVHTDTWVCAGLGERLPPIPRPGTRTLRLRLHRSSRVISLSPISTMPPYTYNVEPDTASCALMRPRGRGASRGGRSPLAGAYRSSDTAPPRRYVLYA